MSATILVIEDNPDNRQLVTWILEDEGYNLVCAETAELGLEALEQQVFDLILMDISLPGMDGKECTRQIRAQEKYKDLPIIALTAHAIKGEHEAIMESGVNDLITKPLDEDHLLQQLERYLSS